MSEHCISRPKDLEGVVPLMDACVLVGAAASRIRANGFCLGYGQQEPLESSASRLAVLQMLANQGIVSVASWDRERLAELAQQVKEFPYHG